MILLLSVFVTNKRINGQTNRYCRYEIFKYCLYSYRNINFSDIYLFILLDDEFINNKESLTNFIYNNFSNIDKSKINIVFDRYYKQCQWIPVINYLTEKHGDNELVFFTQNDDHIFVDFNMDILNEGIELLKNEKNEHKILAYSHWPEVMKFSGKFGNPIRINNYIKFDATLLDSIQISNLKLLFDIFVKHEWKKDYYRIDGILDEFTEKPFQEYQTNTLSQIIYAPLRELVRHFDGYDHVYMDRDACGPLILPSNKFVYSKESLIKKMTANHRSYLTKDNNFQIPKEWIDINLSLHPENLIEYTL
jgi:hypothetical protein